MPFFSDLFSETGLTPHGFCLLWQPGLIWLHVASDMIIGVSYYAIPIALAYLRVEASGNRLRLGVLDVCRIYFRLWYDAFF